MEDIFAKDVLDTNLQNFLRSLLPNSDQLLLEMEEFAQNNHVSIVLPEVGQLLNLLVNLKKPKKVLEIGTGIGYSTIWMARALDENGKITTIELLPKRYEIALSNIKKAGLEDRVKLINGDAREIISEIKDTYDIIFLDAAKGQYQEFFNISQTLLSPNGLLICDNVLINGWVIDLKYPERRKKTMVYRMRAFLENLKNEKDFISSIIPLGDGVALLFKRG